MKKMIVYLLWFLLTWDVLESFMMVQNGQRLASTGTTHQQFALPAPEGDSSSSTAKSSCTSAHNVTTITVPPSLSTEEGYPSPLHKIFVVPLLTDEETATCCRISKDFALTTGRWEKPDSERHESYATCDFPVDECDEMETYLSSIGFDDRLWNEFSDLYGVFADDMEYLDLFVAHYTAAAEDGTSPGMDRLEFHRDGSLLSFSLLLNPPDEFSGGGTMYDALRHVEPDHELLYENGVIRPTRAGDACLHSGKLLHGADTVTSGERTVLVGFVDVSAHCTRPGALSQACTDFGRMDLAMKRYKKQSNTEEKGMKNRNGRLIKGSSHLGIVPAFDSVVRRADPAFQRKKRLDAEDTLLRTMLLPVEERAELLPFVEYTEL